MKQTKNIIAAFSLLVALSLSQPAEADLKTKGEGKSVTLDPGQFSGAMKSGFDLFAKRCTKCHEMARPISALMTGTTPISGSDFDSKGIKKYVVKMMRKVNSGIARDDAKQIIVFLVEARKLAQK